MPASLEFSILSDDGLVIQPFLDEFEAETGIRVRLRVMDWDGAWNQLVRAAIYNEGPDISEIGTTWTGDLIGMNTLRLFTAGEIASLGRAQAFVPAAWANAVPAGEKAWSVPWAAGSRLIFYRPRLLEQAGVDPQNAFSSPEKLADAARALRDCGFRVPLVVPTGSTNATLHNIASWIWARGGDFVSPAGRSIALLEPGALLGMSEYFELGRFLAPDTPLPGPDAPEAYFHLQQNTAMTISGIWVIGGLGEQNFGPRKEFSAAPLPGPSFVGGSNLVIWKFSRQAEAAVQLARFLTRVDIQARLNGQLGLMPTRTEALDAPPYSTEPQWKMGVQALRSGRTFPSIRLWGVIEDRLSGGMDAVWKEIFAHPEDQPRDILARLLTPLCQRLNLMLQDH